MSNDYKEVMNIMRNTRAKSQVSSIAEEIYLEISGFTQTGKDNFKAYSADIAKIEKIEAILLRCQQNNHPMSDEGLRARALIYATDKFSNQFVTAGQFVDAIADFAQQIREDDCKAVCEQCANGVPLKVYEMGGLAHANTMPCKAKAIHEQMTRKVAG